VRALPILVVLLSAAAVQAAPPAPVILVVVRGGPGPQRAALAELCGRHGRVVFDDDAPRTAGLDQAEADAARLRDRARAAVQRTRALYFEAKPEEAATTAQALLAEAAEPLAYAGAGAELRDLHFWLAVSLAKLGRAEAARQAFERAADLGLTPPEPGLLPPEVASALAAGLEAAARRPRGRLKVLSVPAGAAITVDGKPFGRAPVEQVVPAGEHYVAATRFGSQPTVRKVRVAGDAPTLLEIALEPATPSILGRQLAALRSREPLDLDDPEVVLALARLASADEVVTVARQPAPGRTRLAAARWSRDPRRLARAEVVLPAEPVAERAAVLGLEPGLWPPPPAPPPPPKPKPLWKRWWVWTIAAGVATAAAAGIGWAATRPDSWRIVVK
jgi:hypothetical protein